jgi:DNA-binding NtrC family response regulator
VVPPVPVRDDDVATVVQGPAAASTAPEGAYVLTVVSGPDQGRALEVDGSAPCPVLVGQSPACGLQLTDPTASRRHISLEPSAIGLHLVDLDSTNGTFVDRVRVHDVELIGDELVRIGSTVLRVEFRPSAEPLTPPPCDSFGRIVGESREMRRLYPLCARLAALDVTVVIEGESGTGKEVLAEAIHEQSPRATGPFVVFDCTAVPPSLVEAELFGHERGAFTGAIGARKGVFEQARGGTLLIDEIGDLDLALQPKLLRAIERREVRRIGADRWQTTDVRILVATRRNLDQEVQAGRFRDDLFHRLAVARIELPPLRRRAGDVPVLVRAFCRDLGARPDAVSAAELARWEAYSWPGNVRELRNAVTRKVVLGELADVGLAQTEPGEPAKTSAATDPIERVLGLPFTVARDELMKEFERRYVDRVIALHGDTARAASASGIGRRYLQMLRSRTAR